MWYFPRVSLTVIQACLRPKLGLSDTSIVSFYVWPFESHLRYVGQATVANYLELGRWDLFVRLGIVSLWIKNRWSFYAASQLIRYKKPIGRFRRYRVETRLLGWDERSFYCQHQLTQRGTIHCVAILKMLFKKNQQTISPAEIIKRLQLKALAVNMPEGIESVSAAEKYLWQITNRTDDKTSF